MATDSRKPWNTPDFEVRFREAMGREMTQKEREFFGIEEQDPGTSRSENEANGNNAKFAWQALRRISALIG